MCMYVYMEARGQPPVSSLRCYPACSLGPNISLTWNSLNRIDWSASPRYPLVSASQALGLQVHHIMPVFFMQALGIGLRSCLHVRRS